MVRYTVDRSRKQMICLSKLEQASKNNRVSFSFQQQEVFLTSRVTHVVCDTRAASPAVRPAGPRRERRADAMLQRVRRDLVPQSPHHSYVQLTVQKAISLLDKLYDTFFTAPRKAHVRFFTKHFIKIEFLDKVCRPVYKEFDEWPEISVEPDLPKKEKKESPDNQTTNTTNPIQYQQILGQKMTRKSRPRIKEKEEKEQKAGYCEMCNADYADAALHRRSPGHLAFVRDHANFLALDSLISSGADVATFLDKATVNGERRSLRKICNGDIEPKNKRSKRSQSPDSAVNGHSSPRRNGLEEERKHNTRCAKRTNEQLAEDRQYYKVVTSTKLRSSGGFPTKRRESPPAMNGAKPLVVKFRKVRRSELSVLSDEAEQFMFPKRASSTSSTASSDDDEVALKVVNTKRKSPPKPQTPVVNERRRLARPLALKEESSEEDSWPEDKRRRKRRVAPVVKRGRRAGLTRAIERREEETVDETLLPPPEPAPAEPPPAEPEVSPLREEPVEKCMKWEDGKLKYTPAVEQLEFAFESVPRSEPWFETFRRQDQDQVVVKNVHKYFELYTTASPKLPYEIGQLPPLKPNCCPLSDLVKREEKPGPSRAYGTRGMKKQRVRHRAQALAAHDARPRKSPREHASTLAILGSAGLLQRRRPDDAKSTASEDTTSDAPAPRPDPAVAEAHEASERLRQFLSDVFEDAAEFDMSEAPADGEPSVVASSNAPDVSSLVSECERCDLIRSEIEAGVAERARGRRGKFKKKNKTGWPNKRKRAKKDSRAGSADTAPGDRSDADTDTRQSTASEDDSPAPSDPDRTLDGESDDDADRTLKREADDASEDESVQLDLKVVVQEDKGKGSPDKDDKRSSRSSLSDSEDRELRKKRRALQGLLLQPVVRVARVDPAAARRLRSAARPKRAR
ncbi:serine/arginine repetitive matrix protein 1 [Ostrinia nubilalis]|uniref:serine/arginine repetitive matrix protein 1 n=1 Tax=Ostrinia nubilalis TaxID=29057 RepID=UPI0030824CAC